MCLHPERLLLPSLTLPRFVNDPSIMDVSYDNTWRESFRFSLHSHLTSKIIHLGVLGASQDAGAYRLVVILMMSLIVPARKMY